MIDRTLFDPVPPDPGPNYDATPSDNGAGVSRPDTPSPSWRNAIVWVTPEHAPKAMPVSTGGEGNGRANPPGGDQ